MSGQPGETRQRIRLLLVDDEQRVRQALEILLGTCADIEIVGRATSGAGALEAVRELAPDLVLMDCRMATMTNGLCATREIKRRPHAPRVVLLTTFPDLEPEARVAGADAFVVKGSSAETLLDVIRRACTGSSAGP